MINTTQLNEVELTRIYLVANTPSYLYRHYRVEETVQALAKYDVSQLLSALNETAAENRTLKQVVVSYAILVALTFKNPDEVRRAMNQDLHGLTWAEEILAFGNTRQASNQQFTIEVKPKANVSSPRRGSDVQSVFLDLQAAAQ